MSRWNVFMSAVNAICLFLMAVAVILTTSFVATLVFRWFGWWTPVLIGATLAVFFLSFKWMVWDSGE